jgi:hypothetical protein
MARLAAHRDHPSVMWERTGVSLVPNLIRYWTNEEGTMTDALNHSVVPAGQKQKAYHSAILVSVGLLASHCSSQPWQMPQSFSRTRSNRPCFGDRLYRESGCLNS